MDDMRDDDRNAVRSLLRGLGDVPTQSDFAPNVIERSRVRTSPAFTWRWVLAPAVAASLLFFGIKVVPEMLSSGSLQVANEASLPASRNSVNPGNAPTDNSNSNQLAAKRSLRTKDAGRVAQIGVQGTETEKEIAREAVKPAQKIGIEVDPNKPSGPTSGTSSLKVAEILSFLGMSAEFEGDGWRVKSITQNGIAAKSGVEVGDLIEKINDMWVNREAAFIKSFSGDQVTVRRGGQRLVLRFSNR